MNYFNLIFIALVWAFIFTGYSRADVKVAVTIKNGNVSCGTGCPFKDQAKADAWRADNIANDSWGKKERWERYTDQTTCLVIEDVTREVDDVSIPYPDPVIALDVNGNPILDEFGNVTYEPYSHPQVTIVDHQRCRMPVEYTIVQTDITAEVEAAKAKKIVDDAKIEEIKLKDKNMKLTELIELLQLQGTI